MSASTDVAIIGAGPYGLSIAAQLAEHGVKHRILGNPMQFWMTQMPKGMLLKSEGFASNLYDAEGELTLGRFCADRGFPMPTSAFPCRSRHFANMAGRSNGAWCRPCKTGPLWGSAETTPASP